VQQLLDQFVTELQRLKKGGDVELSSALISSTAVGGDDGSESSNSSRSLDAGIIPAWSKNSFFSTSSFSVVSEPLSEPPCTPLFPFPSARPPPTTTLTDSASLRRTLSFWRSCAIESSFSSFAPILRHPEVLASLLNLYSWAAFHLPKSDLQTEFLQIFSQFLPPAAVTVDSDYNPSTGEDPSPSLTAGALIILRPSTSSSSRFSTLSLTTSPRLLPVFFDGFKYLSLQHLALPYFHHLLALLSPSPSSNIAHAFNTNVLYSFTECLASSAPSSASSDDGTTTNFPLEGVRAIAVEFSKLNGSITSDLIALLLHNVLDHSSFHLQDPKNSPCSSLQQKKDIAVQVARILLDGQVDEVLVVKGVALFGRTMNAGAVWGGIKDEGEVEREKMLDRVEKGSWSKSGREKERKEGLNR
jgi:hypothetical protein